MKLISFLACVAAVCSCHASAAVAEADYNVVPLPRHIEAQKGDGFVLTPDVKVLYPAGNSVMERNARFVAEYVGDNLGFTPGIEGYSSLPKSKKGSKGAILLSLDGNVGNKEGYEILVGKNGIGISGATPAGIFYGIQTLRKSLPVMPRDSVAGEVVLPAVSIYDEPRFGYRGMLLDCGRYFLPVSAVKQFIDLMAMHNMNTFHWHLTDDQGWRLELKRHPEITEKGSVRKETIWTAAWS